MGAILLTQIAALPIYVRISNKKGKGYAYRLGLSIWGAGMLFLFFQSSYSPTYLIIINSILVGAGLAAGVMIPWAILPSVADVDELITGKRRTGIYSGMMTLIRKLAQAIALWFIGIALSFIGYIPNVTQSTYLLIFTIKRFFVNLFHVFNRGFAGIGQSTWVLQCIF